MRNEVDVATFVAAGPGAVVIDVREPDEFDAGHVPGARNIPLNEVMERGLDGPPVGPVYVLCSSGNRSRFAADALVSRGIAARSVAGGTQAWVSTGHSLTTRRADKD